MTLVRRRSSVARFHTVLDRWLADEADRPMRTLSEVDDVVGDYDGLLADRARVHASHEAHHRRREAARLHCAELGAARRRSSPSTTFERIGPFKDAMNWSEYVDFLTGWATSRHWECSFKRVTETGDLVFLELEERMEPGDSTNPATPCRCTSSTTKAGSATSTSTSR